MSPLEVLSWPDRLLVAALEWLGEQWNVPTRTDHYLMQVAAEILRTTLKPGHRDKVTTGMFKIPFVDKEESPSRPLTPQRKGGPPVATKEMIVNFNKSRWLAGVSTPPIKE